MITAVLRCKFGDITDDVLEREGIAAKGERGRVRQNKSQHGTMTDEISCAV